MENVVKQHVQVGCQSVDIGINNWSIENQFIVLTFDSQRTEVVEVSRLEDVVGNQVVVPTSIF